MKWLSAPPQNFVSSKFKFPLRSVHKSLSNSAGQKKKKNNPHTQRKNSLVTSLGSVLLPPHHSLLQHTNKVAQH